LAPPTVVLTWSIGNDPEYILPSNAPNASTTRSRSSTSSSDGVGSAIAPLKILPKKVKKTTTTTVAVETVEDMAIVEQYEIPGCSLEVAVKTGQSNE
jgi:hypothetical protein